MENQRIRMHLACRRGCAMASRRPLLVDLAALVEANSCHASGVCLASWSPGPRGLDAD